MGKLLDYYTVTAERRTAFWVELPIATGKNVACFEWLSLMNHDPDHFQLAALTAAELTGCLMEDDAVFIELAVFVTWPDEMIQ